MINHVTLGTSLLLLAILPVSACAPTQAGPTSAPTRSYTPADPVLHDTIVAMDRALFEVFDTCDLQTHASMISDDLEFFHDKAEEGYSNSKAQYLADMRNNDVCTHTTRTLVEGSIEVHPIAGYGAVQLGWHSFSNDREADSPSHASKFVTVWKKERGNWMVTKVISLH